MKYIVLPNDTIFTIAENNLAIQGTLCYTDKN